MDAAVTPILTNFDPEDTTGFDPVPEIVMVGI
jgi:hypothetical protein